MKGEKAKLLVLAQKAEKYLEMALDDDSSLDTTYPKPVKEFLEAVRDYKAFKDEHQKNSK